MEFYIILFFLFIFSDFVGYSYENLEDDVKNLSAFDNPFDYNNILAANRLMGFCTLSVILPEWKTFRELLKDNSSEILNPTDRIRSFWNHWSDLSVFVHSVGQVEVNILCVTVDCGSIKNQIYIVHEKERTYDEKKRRSEGRPPVKVKKIW